MTLFRQLIAGVSLLFLALLAGVGATLLASARSQLQDQLAAQAQDAATSLALRLGTLNGLDDRRLLETIVGPVFDRGYYREIRIVSVGGETLLRRTLPDAQGEVPAWFARLLPIDVPGAQSLVTAGWRELGRVLVQSHPHFAYQQLWHTGLETLAWLLAGYVLAIAAAVAFLAMLLRPLRAVERAARKIGERDFSAIALRPRARELAQVVVAMNTLSENVRRMIGEERERAEGMRREAFLDPVTSVYNRRGFRRQLQSLTRSPGDVFAGALALVEINRFGEFNAEAGFQRGDEVLALVAGALARACEGRSAVYGRLGGAGFGFAAVNIGPEALRELVADACRRVGQVLADEGLAARLHYHCGATWREGAVPEFSELLAAADHALQRAREIGDNRFEIENFDPSAPGGSQAWRARVADAIEQDRLAIFAQEVRGLPGRQAVHREVTVRMTRDDGEPVMAAQFLPMAARHGLIGRLDCRVLEKLLEHLARDAGPPTPVALNVSAHTLADAGASRRLLELLDARPALARRLVFEVTEFGAMQDAARAQSFGAELRRRGARLALDNFGLLADSLVLVHSLRPHYIKLSPGYTRELPRSEGCRFMVGSLVRIGRSLDIGLFAQAVEDEAILALLEELGLAGYQGYAVARPERIG